MSGKRSEGISGYKGRQVSVVGLRSPLSFSAVRQDLLVHTTPFRAYREAQERWGTHSSRCAAKRLRFPGGQNVKKLYRPDNRFTRKWTSFWIRRGGLSQFGRFAMSMAAVFAAPHKARLMLARMADSGFIDSSAIIDHDELILGKRVFIDQRCILYKRGGNGALEIGDRVALYREVYLESGWNGAVRIHEDASIHPRCQINGFVETITIGKSTMLAPFCALYSYDHGLQRGEPIASQRLRSKGPINIGDDAWLGVGVIVTSGVTIGAGAAIGAGSVVTKDIPPNAIATGNPARVVRYRS